MLAVIMVRFIEFVVFSKLLGKVNIRSLNTKSDYSSMAVDINDW